MSDRVNNGVVAYLIAAMIVVIGLAGFSFAKVESESSKLQNQITVVCQEHKLLAETAKEAHAEQLESSKYLLPKINFPGLTHKQLVELTEKKVEREAITLGKYETIAKETC